MGSESMLRLLTIVVVCSEAVSLLQTRAWAVEFHGKSFALSDIDVA